jgi:hypothetical protein
VPILFDIILAFTKSVPELNRPVTRTGNDLSVISTEADGKDVGGVANKTASGVAGVKVPKAKRMIPGRRQSKLAIRRDNDVRYKMIMSG